MTIAGLEKISLGDIQELFKLNGVSMKEALPVMRKFRDQHKLTDRQALTAFGIAKRIFDNLTTEKDARL